MNKILEKIGILVLLVFSFFYTNKTIEVVNNMDDIMIKIKENKDNYEKKLIDTINNNGLVIGINGKTVNVEKSYNKMKKEGYYDTNLFEYDTIHKSIKNEDYIIGSTSYISLVFKVNKNDDLKSIVNILDKNNIKATFFIDYDYFEENSQFVMSLIENHTIGNYNNYKTNKFNILNTIIKNVGNQKYGFCYTETKDNTYEMCKKTNNYTILPSIIINKYPFIEFKNNIKEGSIISFSINKNTIDQLPMIINYINSRNYKTISLVDMLNI